MSVVKRLTPEYHIGLYHITRIFVVLIIHEIIEPGLKISYLLISANGYIPNDKTNIL
jgi:hypothetical protein